MWGVISLFVLAICAGLGADQFYNNRPYPTYSLESMPDTDFSCRDKILGGYYADPDTQCQMFHICVKVAGVGVQDFRFLCPNGTAFDQDHQICADWDDVDCDATTLYYSSDNFDLYRIGSGLESKAKKYGEDEETFALQRAETGDARVNREHQAQRVNQQTIYNTEAPIRKHHNAQRNSNRDIFKGSSSSNFFNNRNGGKETDDDYDDNVNVNQNQDVQRRKVVRKQNRRPENVQNNNQEDTDSQTYRPSRPTGFVNNFAGSSYVPTTSRPGSTTNAISTEQYTTAINNYRNRNGHRHRVGDRQYSNADNFRQHNRNDEQEQQRNSQFSNENAPQYSVSTPAPFRQTQQYNRPTQTSYYYSPTTLPPKPVTSTSRPTEQQQKQTFNNNNPYNQPKENENYPSTATLNNRNTQQYTSQYELTKLKQTENYPTTFAPKNNQYDQQTQFNQKPSTPGKSESLPSTFSPKTSAAFTQLSQQTSQYTNRPSSSSQQHDNTRSTNPQTTFNQYQSKQTTQYNPPITQQKQTTQYTPTVPKQSSQNFHSTTPGSRFSKQYDETQYDDGSYNSKYDNFDSGKGAKIHHQEDEFLKTAHSTNIASSRNEYAQNSKNTASTTQRTYESPRPFSVTPNTPKTTQHAGSSSPNTPKLAENKTKASDSSKKQVKNASYDYAYYDTNVGSEPEYDIGAEIIKSDKTSRKL